MSRYTVTWHRDAEAELTDIWLSAPDRRDVTAAIQAIDDALASDPDGKGYLVAEGLRSFNFPPIRVLYVVHSADRVVDVQLVRRI